MPGGTVPGVVTVADGAALAPTPGAMLGGDPADLPALPAAAVPLAAATVAAALPPAVVRGPDAAPRGFAAQLTRPVATIASAAPGEHVMTVQVTPENLGPVTVQARISADGVQIELFAPSEAGRAAIHAVLPDLRRDLAGTGLGASLDLSQRSAPQDLTGQGGRGQPGAPSGGTAGGQPGGTAGGSGQGHPGGEAGGRAPGRPSGSFWAETPGTLAPPGTMPTSAAPGLDILV